MGIMKAIKKMNWCYKRTNSQVEKFSQKIVVFITCPNLKIADEISEILLEEKLAACINNVRVSSHYLWKGKKESDQEIMMIVKTKNKLLEELTAKVIKIHPYEIPEIIAIPLIGGSDDYLKWIDDVTKSY